MITEVLNFTPYVVRALSADGTQVAHGSSDTSVMEAEDIARQRLQALAKQGHQAYVAPAEPLTDLIAQTDVEIKRLSWDRKKGREYLVKTYGLEARTQLNDVQLADFLAYLQKQPTPKAYVPAKS